MKKKQYFSRFFSKKIVSNFMALLMITMYILPADAVYASTAALSDYTALEPEKAFPDREVFNGIADSMDDEEKLAADTEPAVESGSYYIVNAKSGLYLAASDEGKKIPKLYAEEAAYIWDISLCEDGSYTITVDKNKSPRTEYLNVYMESGIGENRERRR